MVLLLVVEYALVGLSKREDTTIAKRLKKDAFSSGQEHFHGTGPSCDIGKSTTVCRHHNSPDMPHLTELCSKVRTRKSRARQLCCRSQSEYAPHHEPNIFVLEEVDRLEKRVLCNP